MKILRNSLLISFLLTTPCFASLDGGVAFEVRTTGSNANGCGYDIQNDGGTDYSQQDAAEQAFTDLASPGIGSTTLTSANGGFTAQMVDNVIQITSGTNVVPGFYEIDSYTSTNQVTIDDQSDDGVGGLTGDGVGAVGGACADPDFVATGLTRNAASKNAIYIESGTYNIVIEGNMSGALSFIGFKDAHDDDPPGTDRPLIDAQNSRANCINIDQNNDGIVFRNIRVANATADCFHGNGGSTQNSMINFSVDTCGGIGIDDISFAVGFGIEITSTTTIGTDVSWGSLTNAYIHDNTAVGVDGSAHFQNVISEANTGSGFSTSHTTKAFNCVAYGNTGATTDGFAFSSNTQQQVNTWINDTSVSNGRYAFNVAAGGYMSHFDFCNYYGHTVELNGDFFDGGGGFTNFIGNDNTGDVNPLIDAEGLISAGSPLIAAGQDPSFYTSLTGDYKINIGVDQDDNTAGAAATTAYGFSN